jgi:hypothetical protein
MNTVKKAALRKMVNDLFRSNPEGSVIEFVLNGEVAGSYQIPVNHFVTLDSKTPVDWLNQLLCFEVELNNLKSPKVNLRIRQ